MTIFLGAYFNAPKLLTFSFTLLSPIILFKMVKGKAVGSCNAMLSDTFVEFNFQNTCVKKIEFSNLRSFKKYYGKNGPIIYLTNQIENFKLAANTKFCDPESFDTFSKDLISTLDNYKNTVAPGLVHKG